MRKVLIILALALALLLSSPYILAESENERALAEAQSELADIEAKKAEVESTISNLEGQKTSLTADLNWLESRDKQQKALYEKRLEQRDNIYTMMVNQANVSKLALERLENKKAQYGERVHAMFSMQSKSYLELILEAKSLEGMFTTFEFMRIITDADEDAIAELNKETIKAAEEQKKTEASLAEFQKMVDELNKQLKQIKDQKDMTSAELASLENGFSEKNQALLNYATQQEELSQMVADLSSKVEAEQAAAKAPVVNTSPGYVGTGMFLWPVPGNYYITSPFGWRSLDYNGGFHYGTDIGANYWEKVVAPAAGTVILTEYQAEGGNFMIISHGNGITTRYAHLNEFNVSTGQYVEAGQVIGFVGSTGLWTTGPHLHFEVTIGGQHVDPMLYFN